MKIKKILIVLIGIAILGGIMFAFMRKNQEKENQVIEEIIPEQEISEEQERKTIIKLYFQDKETGELMEEFRTIDAKLLANNPCEELIRLLIEGPQGENLQKTLPEGTKINSIKIEGNTVYVDLSKEFIDHHAEGIENERNTIYSIVNTLTELNEVTFVRILIEGQENLEFKDKGMNFKENFERNN